MQDFKKLAVWEKAHSLTLDIYRETAGLPEGERYGLSSQLRRAASSVPANIAEGCGRSSDADLRRFLQVAFGSANELQYHCLLSRDLGYFGEEPFRDLNGKIEEIKRMLSAFIGKLRDNPKHLSVNEEPVSYFGGEGGKADS